jgi:hypothetical protein
MFIHSSVYRYVVLHTYTSLFSFHNGNMSMPMPMPCSIILLCMYQNCYNTTGLTRSLPWYPLCLSTKHIVNAPLLRLYPGTMTLCFFSGTMYPGIVTSM